jgi:hypothetical protein
MGLRSTQGDENWLKGTGFSPYILGEAKPWALAPEGNVFRQSAAQWRGLRFLFLSFIAGLR